MTAHDHTVRQEWCFRCDLSADEVADTPAPAVTDSMVDAYLHAPAYGDEREDARLAIAAALAAAPTVEDWVWCEADGNPETTSVVASTRWRCDRAGDLCPGPHRTLILGPEVER